MFYYTVSVWLLLHIHGAGFHLLKLEVSSLHAATYALYYCGLLGHSDQKF